MKISTGIKKEGERETIKNNQSDMKYILTEMKTMLQGINSRINEAKNQISNLEYKEAKNSQSKHQKEKKDPNK